MSVHRGEVVIVDFPWTDAARSFIGIGCLSILQRMLYCTP